MSIWISYLSFYFSLFYIKYPELFLSEIAIFFPNISVCTEQSNVIQLEYKVSLRGKKYRNVKLFEKIFDVYRVNRIVMTIFTVDSCKSSLFPVLNLYLYVHRRIHVYGVSSLLLSNFRTLLLNVDNTV